MPGYFFVPWRQPEDEVKHPSVKWTRWQTERIPWETVQQYHESRLQAEWCVIAGAVSGVVVVDADDPQALSWCERNLPKTPITCETKRGRHYYFRHPGVRVGNRVNVFADLNGRIDVRGDGGIAVLLGPNRRREPEWTAEAWAEMPVYDPDWFPRIKVNTDAPAGTETPEHAEIISEPSFGPVEERVRLARDYLRGCPGAVQGNGADAYAYGLAACVAWEFALPIGKANEVLFEWGQREDQRDTVGSWYPWDEADIARKILATIEEGPRARRPGSRLQGNHYTLPDDFGSQNATSAQESTLKKQETPPSIFKVYPMVDLDDISPPSWLVDEHIPRGGFGFMFGMSGSFKSFLALDMSLAVAYGVPYLGKWPARKGKVAYLIGEGVGGFPKRVGAWREARGLGKTRDWTFMRAGYNLFDRDIRREILRAVEQQLGGKPDLLVVDTVSRHFGGLSTKESDEAQRWCDGIQADWQDVAVLNVHHSGWEGTRERGALNFRDCADFTIRALREDRNANHCDVECLKQKDGDPFDAYRAVGTVHGDVESASLAFSVGTRPTPARVAAGLFPVGEDKATTIDNVLSLHAHKGLKDKTFRNHITAAKQEGFLAEHHADVKLPKNQARRLFRPVPGTGSA